MSPVESPFAMSGASSTTVLALTPFAMDPPLQGSSTVEQGSGRPLPRPPDTAEQSTGETWRALAGVLEDTAARALLIDDADLLVHTDDVEAFVEGLSTSGFDVEGVDDRIRYRTLRGNLAVDLIVRAAGVVCVDDEMLDRAGAQPEQMIGARMAAPEDRVVIHALGTAAHSAHRWHDALDLIARHDLDWDYLTTRARRWGPRRVLSLLLFAESTDLAVPAGVIESLIDSVHPARSRVLRR